MSSFKNCFLVLLLVFSLFNTEVLCTFGYHEIIGIRRATELRSSEVLTRIIGGTQSSLSAFPFQAGIVVKLTTGWTSICGGALISNTRLLTAAHCWWDGQSQADLFTVVLGSLTIFSGGTRIDTREVTVHPSWNVADILYDVAVIKISTVSFNNNIQSIPLPSVSDINQDFAGLTATASGYGKTSDAQTAFPVTTSLHHTSLPIITNSQCQASFDLPIHASHLCTSGAGGVGTCDGDSGGPLTVIWNTRRILVGIVSFGLSDGCQRGYPSVFSRVTSFINWIQANM